MALNMVQIAYFVLVKPYSREWVNKMSNSWGHSKGPQLAKFLTLWEPSCIGAKEGWESETLFWL